MSEPINSSIMAEYVGKTFDVCDEPARTFCVTLTGVVEHLKTERQETYSIYFHGPADPFLLQGIHKLRQPELGDLSIFLVPIGQDQDGFRYEAVFNHLIN